MIEDQEVVARRAAFASTLKSSSDFAALISSVQNRIATNWAMAATVEAREQQHAKLSALNDVVLELQSWADKGTLAAAKAKFDQQEQEQEAADSRPA